MLHFSTAAVREGVADYSSHSWRGGLKVGVTTNLPHSVPFLLPSDEAGSCEWNYWGNSLFHNQSFTEFLHLPSLHDLSIQQSVGIQVATDGKMHIYMNGKYMACVAAELPIEKPLWGAVDVYAIPTKIKSEILSDPRIITDEKAQQIIDQALKTSTLNQRNVVAAITGLMGSGKTWFLSRLFQKQPPDLYTSTGLAEQSFRSLLHHIGAMTGISAWKLLSNKDILEVLAPLFIGGMTEANMASVTADLIAMADPADAASSKPLSLPAPLSTETSPTTAQLSPLLSPTKPLSLPIESPTGKAMISLVKTATDSTKELTLELIHMIDTGGQPELMEVMPSLIHNADLTVLVLNLLYGLDEHTPITFHSEGMAYKRRKLLSQYTGREIILKLASTFQAKKSCHKSGTIFRLLVVATHRDCVEGDLMARVDVLNRELKGLLLPAFKQELILYETPDKIAFVLNLKNPDDTDEKVLELIRTKVSERGLGEKFRVSGSFFMLEQDLNIFASHIKRDILSLNECVQVGQKLKLNEEEVQAALVLFHRQNTFLYYRHILPNHIFIKPRVLLDFVNSIVCFSYKVSDVGLQGVSADVVSSLNDGIITKEIISHEELSSLFIPGFYEPEHAIKLFCHNFTIAPLSYDQHQSKTSDKESQKPMPSNCKGDYLMMCLLPTVPDQKLPRHIPSSSVTVPLVVNFSKDCVPLNCFSSTISCLLSTYQWKVSRKGDGTPKCLAHNIVTLFDPNLPVKIILVDVAHHIEVYVDSDKEHYDILPQICFLVCKTVFGAIKKVFDVMRLSDMEVSPAVICPCEELSVVHPAFHFTAVTKDYLRCSKTGSCVGNADYRHMMWLGIDSKMQEREKSSMKQSTISQPPISGDPTLPKLLELKIPLRVRDKYESFGTFLLNDDTGEKIAVIKDNCKENSEKITFNILRDWVGGDGITVSWESLIETLRKCELPMLADQIEMARRQA